MIDNEREDHPHSNLNVTSMTTVAASSDRVGATMRRDRWWIQPVLVAVSLTLFAAYTLVHVLVGKYYAITAGGAHLESPFFSPDLPGLFSFKANWPWALLVLWAPLGLRSTCYYYRKSYYRAFFLAPPSCAVHGTARRKYQGETKFPLVLNNLHRFLFYVAVIVMGFLWYDAIRGLFYTGGFGFGVGNGIMFANVVLLSAFTFGCNSWRHIIGGKINCFSCSTQAKVRHGIWKKVSILNAHHQMWAWVSMFSVLLTDLYIWLVSSGVFSDPHHVF
ncbi:MAG: succinate dehydrogenase [Solirubrobacteraceae bacterium]